MKKICWLATGGTIASRPTEYGLAPSFTAQEMLAMLPHLNPYGEIHCEDILQLDSTNLRPQHWQYIARCIEERYQDYDAFVITHGTDTLTWTSAALSCMLENLAKPVAVVGAQRTIEEYHSDAEANLNAAFALAERGYPGVFCVCGGQISEGLWAKKLYSEDLRSIQSVNKRVVAYFNIGGMNWLDYPIKLPDKAFTVHTELTEKIAQVKMMPGLDSRILYALADMGYRGIVLEAYGAGGIPFAENKYANDNTDIISAIEKLSQRGMVFVCTSQCVYDGVQMERYEVGVRACAAGVIPAGKLSTEAASVKLMLALGRNDDLAAIKKAFAEY